MSEKEKVRIGIVGGAGYTAGELLRLLLRHPRVKISFVQSNSQVDRPISSVHGDLIGETPLTFVPEVHDDIDLLFFCGGHGKTKAFLDAHPIGNKIALIDLSNEFRLRSPDHDYVYGLPELYREEIRQSRRIANPGCFATCIQLALLPLAQSGGWTHEVHLSGITGVTGAGQQPSPSTHFAWRSHNLSVYKAFTHQHLAEIRQSLEDAAGTLGPDLHFIPMRGPFSRGILVSAHLRSDWKLEDARHYYKKYYEAHPFTHLVEENPHLKQVVNTNKALVFLEKHGDQLHIVSLIDNLLKGASGQAVQNMNLMFGFEEDLGLRLKASAF